MGNKIGSFITIVFVAISLVVVILFPVLLAYTHYGSNPGFAIFIQGHIPASGTVVVALAVCYSMWGDTKKHLRAITPTKASRVAISNIRIKGDDPGFVYVMRRDDGIIKLGKTINTTQRRKAHQRDYNQRFRIIKRFAVADQSAFERLALRMTEEYRYTEGNRQELRQMNNKQLSAFLSEFLLICREGVDA